MHLAPKQLHVSAPTTSSLPHLRLPVPPFSHHPQEDTSVPPPEWAPNAYFQLSFTQLHVPPGMVLATRVPRFRVPPPGGPGEGAVDLSADNRALLAPGNEQFMKDMLVRREDTVPRCGMSRGLP